MRSYMACSAMTDSKRNIQSHRWNLTRPQMLVLNTNLVICVWPSTNTKADKSIFCVNPIENYTAFHLLKKWRWKNSFVVIPPMPYPSERRGPLTVIGSYRRFRTIKLHMQSNLFAVCGYMFYFRKIIIK